MAKLILIRHSIPLIDPARPARDWVLGAEGHAAAAALAERLSGHGIGAIVSSDEAKARQTAQALATRLQLPLTL